MAFYTSTKSLSLHVLARYIPYTVYSVLMISLIREYIVSSGSNNKLLWSIVLMSILFGGLIWFVENLVKTHYRINGELLLIDSGVSKKEIDISSIQSLSSSSIYGYGFNHGVGSKGLKIIYESGRMVYVSPEQLDHFISELKSINEKIIIQ